MRIITKAWVFAVFSVAVVAITLCAYAVVNNRLGHVLESEAAVRTILDDAFTLQILTGDYVTRRTDRAKDQWRIVHARVGRLLAHLDEVVPVNGGRVASALRAHEAMYTQFEDLVAVVVDGENGVSMTERAEKELCQRLAGQLSTSAQSLVSRVSQISTATVAQRARVRAVGQRIVLLCVVLLASTLLAVSYWMAHSLVRPIEALHRSAETIGSGKFGQRSGLAMDDELGDLSRAMDLMTENLQRITASRDELDAEVRMRTMAEAQLHRTMAELMRSNKELEQFAYVASHDLQEPLRKIHAFGGLLLSQCAEGLSGDAQDYLDRLIGAAHRMQRLIDDLLTFSRVTTRARPFKPTDLNEVVQTVLSDLEPRIQEAKGRVEAQTLPVVLADHTQMGQLFQNLIGNALKFHRDGVPPVVTIQCCDAVGHREGSRPDCGHSCCIAVEDNGIGLDTKYADRIFQVFQRLHGRGQYEGSGIGLAVCRKIVERHGGSIAVSSTPGEGATFRVSLPLGHTEAEA